MKMYRRKCIRDALFTDLDGITQELVSGEYYFTSKPCENGLVTVFTTPYYVNKCSVNYFSEVEYSVPIKGVE